MGLDFEVLLIQLTVLPVHLHWEHRCIVCLFRYFLIFLYLKELKNFFKNSCRNPVNRTDFYKLPNLTTFKIHIHLQRTVSWGGLCSHWPVGRRVSLPKSQRVKTWRMETSSLVMMISNTNSSGLKSTRSRWKKRYCYDNGTPVIWKLLSAWSHGSLLYFTGGGASQHYRESIPGPSVPNRCCNCSNHEDEENSQP